MLKKNGHFRNFPVVFGNMSKISKITFQFIAHLFRLLYFVVVRKIITLETRNVQHITSQLTFRFLFYGIVSFLPSYIFPSITEYQDRFSFMIKYIIIGINLLEFIDVLIDGYHSFWLLYYYFSSYMMNIVYYQMKYYWFLLKMDVYFFLFLFHKRTVEL